MAAPADDDPQPRHSRYDCRGIAGRGGQGIVYRVHDRALGRDVAMKTIPAARHSPEAAQRFLREASATAVLEHPNIVPIHDVGSLDDGRPFYTMRLVAGRSLRDVLHLLREGESAGVPDGEWSLVRLVQVLQQACLALQFAHDRGIVHRDVKPANLLLGAHGEVLLVDWGISKAAASAQTTGGPAGTPHYMAPEQVKGEPLDARADVHALGVLLYEALTLRLPYEAATEAELVAAILRDAPAPPESRTQRNVPPDLAALALSALAKRRDDRPRSARAVHDALQAHVEGLRERERQEAEASRFCAEGDERLARQSATDAEIASLRAEIERLEEIHPAWHPVPRKRPLLDARRRLGELEERSLAELLEAVKRYSDALAHQPAHAPSRRALTDAFWTRFVEAEERRERPVADVYRALVERFHDGRLARELEGLGSIRVTLEPSDATWTLHPLVEEDLVLRDGPSMRTGRGNVELDAIPMGSYVLVASGPDREPARYPIFIGRCAQWSGELRLLPKGSIPDGFIHVPGTRTWLGGDPKAQGSWPLRHAWVDSFLIQRVPVTFADWCAYLDALDRRPRSACRGRIRWERCARVSMGGGRRNRWRGT